MTRASNRPKITLSTLMARKRAKQPISILTAYDFPMAQIEEAAGIDCILVGDSAAQVVLGYDSTLPATMDFMVTIAGAVRRGAPNVFLLGDMPYLSFNVTPEEAIRNAGRFMAQAGCDCVKIEGDARIAETVRAMTAATIPVMVHLGLRPQAVHQFGGYRAQGRDAKSARRLIEEAKILEDAGACMLLLEAVPPEPARIIAESTALPVIGCGAGPYCDGHVVVLHDMLGLTAGPVPKFVKQYADVHSELQRAIESYVSDLVGRRYPTDEHAYHMVAGEAAELVRAAPNPRPPTEGPTHDVT
ncbi:MAG: 3-methyl-2-oxobutanoate hydroxymethyltransferase [Phycisphaerae bacterium]|nr:3-methyl-2-oxobutanoate hydroxymethyltransferase [Phycisphaerae bacterium]